MVVKSESDGWKVNKSFGLGVVISVVAYSVWLISWANSLSHKIDYAASRISEHRQTPAHGSVLPSLARIEARLGAIDRELAKGGRFTESQGQALTDRVRRLEAESYLKDGLNP